MDQKKETGSEVVPPSAKVPKSIESNSHVVDTNAASVAARLQNALRENNDISVRTIDPTDEVGAQEWMQMYHTLFTDPNDMEPDDVILANFREGKADLVLIEDAESKVIGMRLVAKSQAAPDSAYVPYGGIIPERQGGGNYTRALKASKRELFLPKGIDKVMNDCEDPNAVHKFMESYEGEDEATVRQICISRLHFFCAQGYVFVDDPTIKYRRPASDDTSKIQQYDLLGFDIIDQPKYAKYFRTDADGRKTEISKEGFRKMYLDLHSCDQYLEGKDQSVLAAEFPAIKSFLDELDASPKEWFTLYRDPLEKKIAGATY